MLKTNRSLFVLCAVVFCLDVFANDLKVEPTARYRYQQVNDAVRGDATANTLKLRLSASWQANEYFDLFTQADHVQAFNEKDYNSITVTRATSPIADVAGSELNQAWLKYTSDNDWHLSVGRQNLNFDNERHVSSAEFWQNDQTFDAISLMYDDSTKWQMQYAYVNKVHRIFGDDAQQRLSQEDSRFTTNPNRPFLELGNHAHSSHLFNLQYTVNRYLNMSAYGYLLDNQSASQLSTDTLGVRLDGAVKPDTIKFGYTAEFAKQSNTNDNPWKFDAYYFFAELSGQYRSHKVALSHEKLSEDNGFAFATTLGNNHKFLGWADVFSSYLTSDGIRDTAITYRGRAAKLRWRIMAHLFEGDSDGKTAGHEWDFELAYRFNRKWQASLIGSLYQTKGGIAGLQPSQSDLSMWTVSIAYNI